jgi:ATP synthase protein I
MKVLWRSIGIVWEIGYMIVIPAVVFGFLGAWLDKLWGLSPLLLICGLALAFVVSAIAVAHRVRDFVSSMNRP